jgi:metal-responsive CopG/Arc/MetJ family transcriptional regulator
MDKRGGKTMNQVTLDGALLDQLDEECSEFQLSRTEAVEQAVRLWLDLHKGRRWVAGRDAAAGTA